jgi:hypothetical protein
MWPNPPHAATNEADKSSSYCGSMVVARDDGGDGSDSEDKWQNEEICP